MYSLSFFTKLHEERVVVIIPFIKCQMSKFKAKCPKFNSSEAAFLCAKMVYSYILNDIFLYLK